MRRLSKTPTMRPVCSLEWCMKQTTRRRTRYTSRSMQRWMNDGELEGPSPPRCTAGPPPADRPPFLREAREAIEAEKLRSERPKLQTQFADLKRGLSEVTDSEWENLPEVGNLTGKKRRKDLRERTYAVPDSIIAGDRDRGAMETVLDERQQQLGGFETPADGTLTNLVEIGQARDNLLSLKLDQVLATIPLPLCRC